MKRSVCVLFILALWMFSSCTTQAPDSFREPSTPRGWCYLTESTSKNAISIKVPCFGTDNEALDRLMYEHVVGYLQNQSGIRFDLERSDTDPNVNIDGAYSDYSIQMDGRITYESEELISMVFEGMLNRRNSAHPTHLFFSLNVDKTTGKQTFVKDRYVLNDALYDAFLNYAAEALGTEVSDKVEISELCPKDSFLTGLQNESLYYVYFTVDAVGISCPVPHVIGDHFEVEIPYAVLEDVCGRDATTHPGDLNAAPVKTYYSMEHFKSIIKGESTHHDVYRIAPTETMQVTSYGGFCEYPTHAGGTIRVKFYGPELIVGSIEEVALDGNNTKEDETTVGTVTECQDITKMISKN